MDTFQDAKGDRRSYGETPRTRRRPRRAAPHGGASRGDSPIASRSTAPPKAPPRPPRAPRRTRRHDRRPASRARAAAPPRAPAAPLRRLFRGQALVPGGVPTGDPRPAAHHVWRPGRPRRPVIPLTPPRGFITPAKAAALAGRKAVRPASRAEGAPARGAQPGVPAPFSLSARKAGRHSKEAIAARARMEEQKELTFKPRTIARPRSRRARWTRRAARSASRGCPRRGRSCGRSATRFEPRRARRRRRSARSSPRVGSWTEDGARGLRRARRGPRSVVSGSAVQGRGFDVSQARGC